MKHLTIPILEFVLAQPAHKLPVIFKLEKSPLPDCSEEPAEIFQEVLRLQKEGLVEAHIVRDVTGKPNEIQIRYVTIDGKVNLDNRNAKANEFIPFGKAGVKIIASIILIAAMVILGQYLASHLFHRHETNGKEFTTLAPVPVASPEPSLSQDSMVSTNLTASTNAAVSTNPTVLPVPSVTPVALPSPGIVPSPSPLPSDSPTPSGTHRKKQQH